MGRGQPNCRVLRPLPLQATVLKASSLVLLASLAALLASCAGGPGVGAIGPAPCPAGGLAPSSLAGDVVPPRPKDFYRPPLPPPSSVRGSEAQFRLLVDTTGTVVPDSTVFCGVRDAAYLRTLARNLAKMTFEPARRGGTATRSYAYVAFQF